MIVVGYPGIGKSTLAGRDYKYIDLESENFWIDSERAEDWYKPYCKIAEHLSEQGYIVFVSSHEAVRQYLEENSREVVVLVYPSIELKDEWIDKLKKRYISSKLNKDYKALINACEDGYVKNIKELQESCIKHKLEIIKIDYDLEAMLIHLRNEIERYY